jgi:transposase
MSHETMTAAALLPNVTIGLDLGDRTSRAYEVDARGACIREATVPTTAHGLARYFSERARCRVVLEVGTHSPWVARTLAALGHEVIVANPSAMYARGHHRKRNDRLDARFLARQGRADVELLRPIQHRSAAAQQDLELLRARDQLVGVRTKLINHVRGAVKSLGGRLPRCAAEAFPTRVAPELPELLRPALTPLLEVIADLTRRIRHSDTALAALVATRHPVAARLQQPAGVGPLTALAFVLLVEDPRRFRRSRDVGAYFGLVPRLDESSSSTPQLRVSKAGDALGRRLLVSAAQYILGPFGPECDLRRFGHALAARGGKNAKKRAVVAVARKLAVLLHHLWVTDVPYDPDHRLKHQRAATPIAGDSPLARRC